MAYLNPEDKRANARKNYHIRIKKGVCVKCEKEAKGIYCDYHASQHNKHSKRKYNQYVERGVCVRCAKKKAHYPHTECDECKEKARKRKHLYNRKRYKLYKEQGRCPRCGSKMNEDADVGYECCVNCRERKTRGQVR